MLVGLMIVQQLCGINAIIFYSTQIFEDIGVSNPWLATLIANLACLFGVLLALPLMDKLGRKTLFYISTIGMLINLILVTFTWRTIARTFC